MIVDASAHKITYQLGNFFGLFFGNAMTAFVYNVKFRTLDNRRHGLHEIDGQEIWRRGIVEAPADKRWLPQRIKRLYFEKRRSTAIMDLGADPIRIPSVLALRPRWRGRSPRFPLEHGP